MLRFLAFGLSPSHLFKFGMTHACLLMKS